VQGDREAVTIEARRVASARIRVRSVYGRLSIDAVEDRPLVALPRRTARPGRPRITVALPHPRGAGRRRRGQVAAASIETQRLAIEASGATSVEGRCAAGAVAALLRFRRREGEFGGTLDDQTIAIAGAGDYRAPGLE